MKELIYNHKEWIQLTSPELLFKTLSEFLTKSGYTVISSVDYNFSPEGYTCLWLLAESHLAIHTFPERGITYLELSGCNNVMNEKFIRYLNIWKSQVADNIDDNNIENK
jgi:S-adenosylmethionine decarboxylase